MKLTHFDSTGDAIMVDVGEKEITHRKAIAKGTIKVNNHCFQAIKEGTSKKGDVLGVARIAGIMGAKKTSELIPLCHLLAITNISVQFDLKEEALEIEATCTVKVCGKTGVEMEALTGVSVALLTIYDMCKAIDRSMQIGQIYLVEKRGGTSDSVWA